ncbi:MAG: sugar phosphate isomerase/epimerase [Arenibacter sp.]|nr:sugar phosphate isomerase/epimerase [Eudoraea sp.]NNG08598.1 sugar phosphate isomerase/epimerase [Arenibacter sp.]NNL02099.1 sugar phosphate isomerase/epimerase [Eudoraea sp.]
MNRKDFIRNTALLTAGGYFLPNASFGNFSSSDKRLKKVGIQLFSIAQMLEKDFVGTISMLATMGYKEIEMFGPYPYSSEAAKNSWQSITPMLGFSGSGYFGLKEKEVKAIFKDHDLKIPAIHTDLLTLENHMDRLSKAAETLDFEYVILPAIPEERRQTLDDYKKIAYTFNTIGKAAKEAGLKFAYHNHGYGLQELEGVIPMQHIIEHTDPKYVFFEMDVVWTLAGKANPIHYLNKYSDRYKLMHVKDMKTIKTFKGDGSSPIEWMEIFPQITTLGKGAVSLDAIIAAATSNGVKHFFIEYERAPNPEVTFKESLDYLTSLRF